MFSVSVFETQYTAVGVRHATRLRLPPSAYSSNCLPLTVFVCVGLFRIGGFSQVVPCTP